MKKIILLGLFLLFSQMTIAAGETDTAAGTENPAWFKQSFLELQDDLEDANDNNKHLMLYFHQDGCPYCKKLVNDNFSRTDIVAKMKQDYDLLEINMWGDKSVTSINGDELSEKEFARQMKVMYTPTLVILDSKGHPMFRMNGYYHPDKFLAVLDFLSLKNKNSSRELSFTDYLRQKKTQKKPAVSQALPGLHREKFITKSNDLHNIINTSNKPVMVLFEQNQCAECDELHGDLFRRLAIYKKLKQFSIVQININSKNKIVTPDGQTMTQIEFSKREKIQYTPSIFFYAAGKGTEKPIFRSEAYLKGFHLEALLDYVSSGAYQSEAEFQRFIQRRADEMAAQGIKVDLWK